MLFFCVCFTLGSLQTSHFQRWFQVVCFLRFLFEGTCPHPGRFLCNGMRSLAIAPRILIGPPAAFRVIFTHPLFRHLCVEIILFLADETSGFTADTQAFAQTSSFLLRLTLTFRRVDTPSVGSPVSPVYFLEDSDG